MGSYHIIGRPPVAMAAMSGMLLMFSTGCATKKYVGRQVAPIDKRVGEMETKSQKTDASIASLEQGVSRVDERAQAADKRAGDAAEAASRANDQAVQSGQKAETAQRAAADAKTFAETRSTELDQKITALDNFQLVGKEVVLFPFNKSELTDDAKKQLDSAVGTISGHKRYMLEVQGFTDKTGKTDYNLELSRKRAQSVVRYLTLQHNIPLYRIHVIGLGDANPANTERGAEARKQNRRVELKLYSTDAADAKKSSASGSGQ